MSHRIYRAMNDVLSLLLIFALAFMLGLGLATFVRGQEVQTADIDANPTPEQLALGNMLIHEKHLSTTGEKSCISCHDPGRAFTDGFAASTGVNRQVGTRTSMTMEDAVFKPDIFWDGRARFLEGQATQPIVAAKEMGQQTLQQAFNRIAQSQGYQGAFERAFGRGVNVQDGIRAIAMIERTIVHGEAPIDRYEKGEHWVFNAEQNRGREIFFGSGKCTQCHFGPSLSDHEFHVVLGRTQDRNGQLDRGRGAITNRREDNFKFATPTLRDIGKRGPFFHAGQARDLDGVVDLLDNPPQGSELRRLNLSDDDKKALVTFLSTAFESYVAPTLAEVSLPNDFPGEQRQARGQQRNQGQRRQR
jgi:cytochrome c peroxidase